MGTGTGKKMVTKKRKILLPELDPETAQPDDPEASQQHDEGRQARVEAIREQVEAGTYRVDSRAVARAILKRSI